MTGHILRAAMLLAALGPASAFAQSADTVQISGAWARATPPHAGAGAVYLTLNSPHGDKLTGASTPAAARASVHRMRMEGEIMRMRAIEGGLNLPAGQPVTLAPDGYHIMLEELKAPLLTGQTLPLHLTFQKSPPVDVEARILAVGAGSAMPGMAMGK